ncbi:magnesium transporter [Ruminococcaceae bacterium OttesenSCG-928-I18]|nr:magnesium transporter [Ruminococcaceae bacterium OttesenSCG-928-I18]
MAKTTVQSLEELFEKREYRALREVFSQMNNIDLARLLEELPTERAVLAFRTLPKDAEMDVFAELDAETQHHIIAGMSEKEVAAVMEDLAVDDAVDMLEELPATLVKKVLKLASPETRAQINQFLRYPEDSAGSIMTAEFTDLHSMLVEDAIKRIRRVGEDRETIYTCYVMDDQRHLDGVVTVKDLLLAQDGEKVENLMEPDVISVQTTSDQEEAVRIMVKYDLISLPVVDGENRLVGIVTVDDAVDVLREEDTEDFEIMNAMAPSERPYLKTGVFTLARNRFGWLLILMVSAMFTGSILGHYEPIYVTLPLLVTFIPMLTGTGGNAGSQSSTMIIRGIALGEVRLGDFFTVLWKEMRISVLVGVVLAIVNFVRMLIFYPGSGLVSLTVSLALVGAVLFAKVIGGTLPILAKACRLDPALLAAPVITTVVDALTLVLYFNLARVLLL